MTKQERILIAAQELFGIHGFAKCTVKMIAARADVAFGLVAHYYGSKENLFIQAGFHMAKLLLDTVKQETRQASNGLDGVARFIRGYLEFTLARAATFTILLRCSPFSDVRLAIDCHVITDIFTEIIQEIHDHLQRGMEDGSIRALRPRDTAFAIYGNIVGAVRTRFIAPYDVPGLYGETVRFVLHSVAADRTLVETLYSTTFNH